MFNAQNGARFGERDARYRPNGARFHEKGPLYRVRDARYRSSNGPFGRKGRRSPRESALARPIDALSRPIDALSRPIDALSRPIGSSPTRRRRHARGNGATARSGDHTVPPI